MKTYWISFANDAFLGVVIVDAHSEAGAMERVNSLGLNPGGEALLLDMSHPLGLIEVSRFGKDRLLTAAELNPLGYRPLKDFDPSVSEMAEQLGTVVCESCNTPK